MEMASTSFIFLISLILKVKAEHTKEFVEKEENGQRVRQEKKVADSRQRFI